MPSRVPHVASYRRTMPVSLERMYENAIDWEHLPWLHRSTFARIEHLDSGDWGFRARVWTQPYDEQRGLVIELKLDRDCRRWITTTLDGSGAGTEIWTHAFTLSERTTMVVVDFFVPGIDEGHAGRLAKSYPGLYARLYDEDVWMMTTRQSALDRVRGSSKRNATSMNIGTIAEVRARLPMEIEFNGAPFRIVELGGEMLAHSAICAHSLGPLGEAIVANGVIECPWHGYRFDVRTGNCVSGAECRLARAPFVREDKLHDQVVLELSENYDR